MSNWRLLPTKTTIAAKEVLVTGRQHHVKNYGVKWSKLNGFIQNKDNNDVDDVSTGVSFLVIFMHIIIKSPIMSTIFCSSIVFKYFIIILFLLLSSLLCVFLCINLGILQILFNCFFVVHRRYEFWCFPYTNKHSIHRFLARNTFRSHWQI